MKRDVLEHMLALVDRYVSTDDLNRLLKRFIGARAEGGSRWSELTESAYRMMGGKSAADMTEAAALSELIMLTLDIVDDLQDRDKPHKAWMTCPEPFTLNAVLALLAAFMGEVGRLQRRYASFSPYMATTVSELIAAAVSGQQKDLNPAANIADEADYFAMVQLKSGSLIRLACYMGYALAENVPEAAAKRLDELCYCLGVVAQIENDVKNMLALDVRGDLIQRKRTLPILHLLSNGAEEFPALQELYEGRLEEREFAERHREECMRYIEASGCIEYSRIVQSLYYDKAVELYESIDAAPAEKERFRLAALAPYEAAGLGKNV
ncbi:class 1 isoprenoid biosynthesis enzyme [Paenibacillus doosanensis]|uniref:Heptaprenyl diphosphate synthase component 2 n=1 Tax=Paenibacillus konkukensis TaxID=2020716 RepID=A0ABY4RU17_9BACL|nr:MULTISPECIES: polyprenyl synthetase family protein [Paenibacillus]MCS7463876.1 class 1 isoprenoid biosynthesis enzyme [Paenibacillus doosanensis]UQZ85740.1 Heptaprenyl diphosphate synthase component 2 [Paenibacillus konkukensis]